MALSVDMCPSTKPYERDFFASLVAMAAREKRPIPVAMAMSGLWILQHEDEWKWLCARQEAGELDITWVNHSYTHMYLHDEPLEWNFLAHQWSRLEAEILLTERLMLESGVVPSVFFRAPGLVTNDFIVGTLRQHGLILLGADAWLAKGQPPHQGSVILVHGNSHEPGGLALATQLLAAPGAPHLVSLAAAVVGPSPVGP